MASGIAAGPSIIFAEMLKPVGEAGAVEVRDLIEDIILEGCIPTNWQESFIVNLYKGKGDALNRGNYRAWSWLSKWWRCGWGTHQTKSWDRWDAVWLHIWPWHYWCNFYCTSATGEALGCQQAALHGLRRPEESIWSSSTGCHLVGNAQTRNWRVVGASGPVHVQGCEKQGKSRRWVQRGVWCWSGCSSGLCP